MGQIIGAHEFKSSHYVLPNIKIPVALGLKKKVIFGSKIIALLLLIVRSIKNSPVSEMSKHY